MDLPCVCFTIRFLTVVRLLFQLTIVFWFPKLFMEKACSAGLKKACDLLRSL